MIAREWLPRLQRDKRAEAPAARLKAYCHDGYHEPPDGLRLQSHVEDVATVMQQRGIAPAGPPQRSYGGRRY